MTDFSEALRIIALDVVGWDDPDGIHDQEILYWGDIRRALQIAESKPFQRKCWQAGSIKDHLCGSHCASEATQEEIDAFVREYRAQQLREANDEYFRRVREGKWL